jgi:hypothetical protein
VLPPLTLLEVVSVKAPGEWEYLPGMRINQPLITVRITIRGLVDDAIKLDHLMDNGMANGTTKADVKRRAKDAQHETKVKESAVAQPRAFSGDPSGSTGGMGTYKALLRMAMADGGLAAAENAQLEKARRQYGISWEQHHHFLNEITNGSGVVRILYSQDPDSAKSAKHAKHTKQTKHQESDDANGGRLTLAEWLEEKKISGLLKLLQDFGADTVDDLRDLEEEDLQEIEKGAKKLQIKRFRRALEGL